STDPCTSFARGFVGLKMGTLTLRLVPAPVISIVPVAFSDRGARSQSIETGIRVSVFRSPAVWLHLIHCTPGFAVHCDEAFPVLKTSTKRLSFVKMLRAGNVASFSSDFTGSRRPSMATPNSAASVGFIWNNAAGAFGVVMRMFCHCPFGGSIIIMRCHFPPVTLLL